MVWLNSNDPVKDIDLYIDSFGGSVEESLTIYDTIVNSSAPVTGIVCRQAKSMASVILQGCKKRVAYKNATILIHDISRGEVKLEELETADNLDRLVSEMRKMQGKVHSILAKRTGKSIQQIRGECRKNRPMDADEALKFGLIDKIV